MSENGEMTTLQINRNKLSRKKIKIAVKNEKSCH